MGDTEITLEIVEEIERTANGKLRAVVCRIAQGARDTVLGHARSIPLQQAAG
jgi:hypothetical protein